MSTAVLIDTKSSKQNAGAVQVKDELQPSAAQRAWLVRGLSQPGGKLPLFDESGQRISPRTIQSSIDRGWAEPWFANPTKPDWLVCKLTELGRNALRRR
ncbi:MAG TPA: hypothetical protein VJN67_15535 [Stellaceae bacterium]|nr:hypothetical protein [Stellaceae bacterium]